MAHEVVAVEKLLATAAKVLCSAVFISGRDPAEAFANSAFSALHAAHLAEPMSRIASWRIDRDARRVDVAATVDAAAAGMLVEACRETWPGFEADFDAEATRLSRLGTVSRSARYLGDQGSLILPRDGDERLFFTPVPLRRGPSPGSGWLPDSMRDPQATRDADFEDSRRRVDAVLRAAMLDRQGHHAAILVARGGHIVGERYAEGFHADMPLESWSMGKTVMGALIGLLVARGVLELDQPAPVAAWRVPGDSRGRITVRHLLNMSSGLACVGFEEPRERWNGPLPEHFLPYAGAIDVARFATCRQAEHLPATVGRYRNCDPLTLSTIFHDTVRDALGDEPLSWPQRELFDALGMHGFVHEVDRWGRFIISGFNYGTARDWARFGHLYLNDGAWDGRRILPAGWVEFCRTPAPAWPEGAYGGQLWINSNRAFPLPADTFYLYGGGGQYVFVVPGSDLVIVRQGHTRGWAGAKAKVEMLLRDIMAALWLE